MSEKDARKSSAASENSGVYQAGPSDLIWSLWAVWVIILFIVTMLLFFIPFLLFSYFRKDPQRATNFVRLSRIWMRVFLTLAGCPLRVKGREHFQKGETYIVLCNHNALLDVPVSTPFIPGGNKTIAKVEMARIPLFGMMYRTGSVLVDRKDEANTRCASWPRAFFLARANGFHSTRAVLSTASNHNSAGS